MKSNEAVGSDAEPDPLQTDDQRRKVLEQLYSPLRSWETRLLGLQPGQPDEPLVATLHVAVITLAEGFGLVDRDQIVEFEAISYSWGGQLMTHQLMCNGLPIGITANLSAALRHMRWKDGVRYLWADAVCINQLDNEEKARQIRSLETIFKRASQVIVWLGENEHPSTDAAIAVLREFIKSGVGPFPGRYTPPVFEQSNSESEVVDILSALLDLITRPWVKRAWVVQEVNAARSATVHCGSTAISWSDYKNIVLFFDELLHDHWWRNFVKRPTAELLLRQKCQRPGLGRWKLLNESSAAIYFLNDPRAPYRDTYKTPRRPGRPRRRSNPADDMLRECVEDFYEMLKHSAHLEATDPRDRIWALVGLSQIPVVYGTSGEGKSYLRSINIDYNKPVVKVHAEVTKLLLHWLDRVDLLLPFAATTQRDSPSWILDLGSMQLPRIPSHTDQSHESHRFFEQPIKDRWGEEEPLQSGSYVSHNWDWPYLALRGCHIGTICSLGSSYTNFTEEPHGPKDYPEYFFRALRNEASAPTRLVEVQPTQSWLNWILQDAPSLTWSSASDGLKEFSKRVKVPSKETALERLKRLTIGYLPRQDIESYVAQSRTWGIAGAPEVNDMIIACRSCDFALVLRKSPGSTYQCVGRARPLDNLRLNGPTPTPASRGERERHSFIWDSTWIPYRPGQIRFDKESFEDEDIFRIH